MKISLEKLQGALNQQSCAGWLLYDFRGSNSIALDLLHIPPEKLLTRRFFYWVPKTGEPVKIVSAIEQGQLDHLPGREATYTTWEGLHSLLQALLSTQPCVAMEYSPENTLPYISKVDAGTYQMLNSLGIKIVSSAALLQLITRFSEDQIQSHNRAAAALQQIVEEVWSYVEEKLMQNATLNEYLVQQFMLNRINELGFITEHLPICSVNANSANPHYQADASKNTPLKVGDFLLIDLWCKEKKTDSIYADISRVAVLRPHPSELENRIFAIITNAQDAAIHLIRERFDKHEPIYGFEVDDICRKVIAEAGYGKYFIHRTGHNIGTEVHGSGAHLDNYETHDNRELIAGSCFSIEPGIYLPGKFGMRLEFDVLINTKGEVQITGGRQAKMICLTSF